MGEWDDFYYILKTTFGDQSCVCVNECTFFNYFFFYVNYYETIMSFACDEPVTLFKLFVDDFIDS